MNQKSFKEELKSLKPKNFLFLFLAGIINAFGVTIFIYPLGLYDSGISGLSIFLDKVTPEYLTLSLFLILFNIPLFLVGLKKQGLTFTIYAIFAVISYSLWAFLINDVFPIDVSSSSPLAGSDLLLCAFFGGIISGAGSGLAIRYGGAMDGVEVLAVVFAKKIGLTVGTFVMVFNIILYLVIALILKDWILPLYSIITYITALRVVDYIVEGFDRAKAAIIITNKPKEICSELSQAFGLGITQLDAHSYYSNTNKTMLYIVVNRFQIRKMKDIVHIIDEQAYITISEVADVYKGKQIL